jgi:putative addiction module component (TIGR02574 family)
MSTDSADVFDVALSLPENDRARLAYTLMQSFKPPSVLSDDDPGFVGELERRIDAYEAGETTADDWETVSERLRESLENHRNSQ